MNKRSSLLFLVLVLVSMRASSDNCRCFKLPFDPDPPCFARCSTNLLVIADADDLTDLFGFNRETADAVLAARQKVSSPDQDLLALLSEEQRVYIAQSFSRIDDDMLLSFIATESLEQNERQPFMADILASIPPSSPEQTLLGAVRRAKEADEEVEGRLLYETVLADDKVKFGFDTSELSPEFQAALDEFAGQITRENKDVFIEIQGHTDNVGLEKYNEELGLIRADAVRRYLVQKHGIPLERINVFSYGEQVSVSDNATREGRSQNRRVTLVVLQ